MKDLILVFLFRFFSVMFDNICMERTSIRASSFNIEKGLRKSRGAGGLKFCVCSRGFEKSVICQWGGREIWL